MTINIIYPTLCTKVWRPKYEIENNEDNEYDYIIVKRGERGLLK